MKKMYNTNARDGIYLVTAPHGWCADANPFRAFVSLAKIGTVTGEFVRSVTPNGKPIKVSDNSVTLYYIPCWGAFSHMEYGKPMDAVGREIGFVLFSGVNDHANIDKLTDLLIK